MLNQQVKWNDKGLVPVIVQNAENREVLMLAYMNNEALEATLSTGRAHYYSRSRQKLWMKGETSGNVQIVRDLALDCDADTILLKVEQTGFACHTGSNTCFDKDVSNESKSKGSIVTSHHEVLEELLELINDRKINPKEGSYTCKLFNKGLDVILKKIGEEASEVIIGAKNDSKDEVIYESCDLIYHLLVLLSKMDITLDEIYAQLEKRR